MIEIKKLYKTYKTKQSEVHALNGASLKINSGDIFGIIGFSGAGKSTLIRCINLLEEPDSGDVIINGQSMLLLNKRELRTKREKIGMIFQHFNLLDSRTVFGNIAVGSNFIFEITNTSDAAETITVTAGSGVTLWPASQTIAQNAAAKFRAVFTNITASSEAVTIYKV